ncbi:MAG: SDR family oxidoreductase [Rhodothermales bacterium]|nr:SDR family oxidoreductase [Rhodothermales bacterium]MBO6781127.1 SDR family oxidoreductase [Rhodothermales bacterium]
MKGQVHVVIGASGGIGSAVARRLAEQGALLMLAARREEPLQELADELGCSWRSVDATSFDEVKSLLDAAVAEFGRLDGLLNCAGSILLKSAHLTSEDEYRATIDTNLTSAFFAVKAGARAMMKEGGSIVLCSSAVAQTGLANHEAIAAAKAGVVGLMRSAAATYAPRGVRVNCVAPGLVDSPMSARIVGNEAALKQSEAMHALGRIGRPEDVADPIVWLLDGERSSWVTGQVIGVDGGLGSLRPR